MGLVGAFVAPSFARRYGGPRVLLASVLFFPLGFLVMAAVSGPVWWCVLLIGLAEAVVGVAVVCYSVCAGAETLRETPPELIGRVNASINFLTQGALGIGGCWAGWPESCWGCARPCGCVSPGRC